MKKGNGKKLSVLDAVNLTSLTGSDWSGREVGVKIPSSSCVGYLMCLSYTAIS